MFMIMTATAAIMVMMMPFFMSVTMFTAVVMAFPPVAMTALFMLFVMVMAAAALMIFFEILMLAAAMVFFVMSTTAGLFCIVMLVMMTAASVFMFVRNRCFAHLRNGFLAFFGRGSCFVVRVC